MKCPKCEEGNVIKVIFKNSGDCGLLCDHCEALWFENERINKSGVRLSGDPLLTASVL